MGMGTYKTVILEAFLLFPVVALLITVPYLVYSYRRYGSALGLRTVVTYSFVLYLMCVYFLVVLPLPPVEQVTALTTPYVQLMPFAWVSDMFKEAHIVAGDPASYLSLVRNKAFLQAFFNMVMTVPFGMYLRYYFRCGLLKTTVLSLGLSLFFELTQLSGLYGLYPRPYRIFDVDDLILNTLGGVVGYALVGPLMRVLPTREELDAASLRRGRQVSFMRRVLALAFDGVVVAVLCGVVRWILGYLGWIGLPIPSTQAVILTYFVAVPMVLGGRTLGYALLRLRVVADDGRPARWWQLVARFGTLVGVFVLLPWVVDLVLGWRVSYGLTDSSSALLLKIVLGGLWAFVGLYLFIRAAMHRPLFYERLSRTKLVSTVEE